MVCWDEQIEARQTERQRATGRLRAALNEGRAIADAPAILELLGPEVRIGINLSEADLGKDDFVHHLIEVVDDSPLNPANLTIEVT